MTRHWNPNALIRKLGTAVMGAGVLVFSLCTAVPPAAAQQQPQLTNPAPTVSQADRVTNAAPSSETTTAPTGGDERPTAYLTFKTPYEFWLTGLTIALLVFMGVLLCTMAWKSFITPEFLRAFIILLVIFAALFLIVAGYTDKQTAPVFSLLGTIIGYIFGRITTGNAASTPTHTATADAVNGARHFWHNHASAFLDSTVLGDWQMGLCNHSRRIATLFIVLTQVGDAAAQSGIRIENPGLPVPTITMQQPGVFGPPLIAQAPGVTPGLTGTGLFSNPTKFLPNPIVGKERIGFFNQAAVPLKFKLELHTERLQAQLEPNEVITFQTPAGGDIWATVGTGDVDTKIKIERGTIYVLRPLSGKWTFVKF